MASKLLCSILIGNHLDLMQQHSFAVYCDWLKLFLRSKQQLTVTLCGRKLFCGDHILFLLRTWFTVQTFKQYCMGQFTWMVVLSGFASSLAPLRWEKWLSPNQRSIINSSLCWAVVTMAINLIYVLQAALYKWILLIGKWRQRSIN